MKISERTVKRLGEIITGDRIEKLFARTPIIEISDSVKVTYLNEFLAFRCVQHNAQSTNALLFTVFW